MDLWEALENQAIINQRPWLIGGDFNVITSEEEKYGGLPVTVNEVQGFNACIHNCSVVDLGFKGGKYTWWNGQSGNDYIFKRLDRLFRNQALQNKYAGLEADFMVNPFNLFHHKLKKVKNALANWSKITFGNIFLEIETLEKISSFRRGILEAEGRDELV
ncbi:uncharacterized protein LOC132643991 [Lycium barbarum]|uniref:uncharacterized protein LOC132643991 n=1 Tax=Lycium barbarum TaxID=112863 RepID=UPI00293F6D16|nr:uncharacterized protein LOC132643991 [Lycium barbarum]